MNTRTPESAPSTGGASDRPHLLYVAWGYPPCRGSGVYRAWATANMFAASNWRVTVITAPRETFLFSTGIDASLERTVDPRIKIVRVPFDEPRFTNDLRTWSRWRAHHPELWSAAHSLFHSPFPERGYGSWRPGLEAAARQIHAADPVDLVIGTANPHVDFIPGHILHKEHGVPYVMDYRDAWQLDVFNGKRLTGPGSPVDRWERDLIRRAQAVWFVNDPIREWHARLYPDDESRFHVVANGYDQPFDAPATSRAREAEGLVFGYVGTLSESVPLGLLVDAWKRARVRDPLVAASRIELWGHLGHLGTPSASMSTTMASFGENAIDYKGPVEKGSIQSVYERFDALLLLLGTGRYVTSGKVFEYLATGLPIVSAHHPDNAATDVLRGAPQWVPTAELSVDAIAESIATAATLAREMTPVQRRSAQEFATRYSREAQLAPQIRNMTELVRGASERAPT